MHHYRADEIDVLTTTASRGLTSLATGVQTLTEAVTLTAADHGKVFILATAGGFAVTLPNIAGFACRFIVGVAPTTAYVITAGTADSMAGSVFSSSGAAEDTEAAATGDVINFVANTAVVGDQIDIVCDGTRVFARGFCSAAGGITITG